MKWEPTTRGTKSVRHLCHFDVCSNDNTELGFVMVDYNGARFFCTEHWKWVCALFALVGSCDECIRNHRAEYLVEERFFSSAKFIGRWWDLCGAHFDLLDGRMCIFMDEI